MWADYLFSFLSVQPLWGGEPVREQVKPELIGSSGIPHFFLTFAGEINLPMPKEVIL